MIASVSSTNLYEKIFRTKTLSAFKVYHNFLKIIFKTSTLKTNMQLYLDRKYFILWMADGDFAVGSSKRHPC